MRWSAVVVDAVVVGVAAVAGTLSYLPAIGYGEGGMVYPTPPLSTPGDPKLRRPFGPRRSELWRHVSTYSSKERETRCRLEV